MDKLPSLMTLNFHPSTMERIQEIADQQKITPQDVMRRAFGFFNYLCHSREVDPEMKIILRRTQLGDSELHFPTSRINQDNL